MLCPKCSNETNVTDSRTNGSTVKRRRECTSCKERFTTFEIMMSGSKGTHMKDLVILDRRHMADTLRTSLDMALNETLSHSISSLASSDNGPAEGR